MPGDSSTDSIPVYHAQAEALVAQYESMDAGDPAHANAAFAGLLPTGADRLALDVGAGSGRDAAWLAGLGFEVVAAEPAQGMRAAGQRLHPDAAVRWLDDRLPGLDRTHALGLSFDVVLLSAVWQHVAPSDRQRAFRKLATLLKPGGLLVVTLRHGPPPPDRPMHEVTVGEIEALAREHGLSVSRSVPAGDSLGRPGVSWTTMCLTLPDDGAGALPLLRGIVANDDKSSTYKLGLLRAVAKVADLTPSLARAHPTEDRVEVPLGAVALNWVRMYLPLVARGLPQTPGDCGPDGLGFAKEGFRALLAGEMAAQDLRVGAAFAGERALAVAAAIGEAARTIANMPANFIRYPNSDARVFGASVGRARRSPSLVLSAESLAAYGALSVPGHVWRAMQRLGAWIEPVLVAEWSRIVRGYAERRGGAPAPGEIEGALAWIEPVRDVRIAREAALSQMAAGRPLRCVWSDRPLTAATLDVDHCLPWSAWPCGDLWNLMPAHRIVNQREKRDRLPSAGTLAAAWGVVVAWWDDAWRGGEALGARFAREVDAALPVAGTAASEEVFAALEWRRLRLRQDQQLAEWSARRGG